MSTEDVAHVARGFARVIESRILKPLWRPLPHQVPPRGDWYGWALLAGRGAGKTDACARYMVDHVKGPPCLTGRAPHWMSIIAPTQGDAATSGFYGPSGISAHDDSATLRTGIGGAEVHWPNGSVAKLFGAHTPEDVERLRSGGNRCLAWLEELAAWRYLEDCWNHMRFGLRVGPRPRWVGSTTPKPRPLIKKIARGEIKNVETTRATMYDNPHLPQEIRDALEDAYGGTALGAQELLGRIISQDENALWTRETLERYRINPSDPLLEDLQKITVGVDPSGGAGEQGIIVSGSHRSMETVGEKVRQVLRGYVLDDRTVHLPPDGWGRASVKAAVDWQADDICVEINFGGDMAVATIRSAAEAMGVDIPVRVVRASRGKQARAEPVSAKSAQGRWNMVGEHEALEDQLCTWTPDIGYSPDRLDGMVWDAWHLKIATIIQRGQGSFPGSAMTRTSITGGRG